MTLFDKLRAYSRTVTPMHMPGHKRNTDMSEYLRALAADLDISEINGFDDLRAPAGILLKSMKTASLLWGSDFCSYLTGGSTSGILAAVYALSGGGGRAVIARNCHKSVFSALEITGLDAVFAYPEFDAELGVYASLTPNCVRSALENAPDARFVLLTSPTYEGAISDIEGICRVAHAKNVPVIVDSAHGAHLGLCGVFNAGALSAGADVVVHSLHKTLPSLTQTAVLHVKGNLVDAREISRSIAMFETSSPSYLLMASADGCVNLLKDMGASVLGGWKRALNSFYERVEGLSNLRVGKYESAVLFDFDMSKIIIRAEDGVKLMNDMLINHSIELEMAYPRYALAMTGAGDTLETLNALANALEIIDARTEKFSRAPAVAPAIYETAVSIKSAVFGKRETVPLDSAEGRVCAEYAYAYPPGVPLIVPGEIVSGDFINRWRRLKSAGVRALKSHAPDGLLTVVSQ